jgi:proliferating cell nuclear antigen
VVGEEGFRIVVEYPSGRVFSRILEMISSIVDEALFTFGSDGLRIKALDPAQVALVSVYVPSSSFLTYNVVEETSVGVNLSNLMRTLPKPKKSDKVVLRAGEDFYEFLIESVTVRRYRYRSIEVPVSEVPEISLEFKVRGSVYASAFKTALNDLRGSGTIVFEASDNQVLKLLAPEIGGEVSFSIMSGSLIELEVDESSKSSYDESYIIKVLPLCEVTDAVKIEFSTDQPIRLTFNLPGGEVVEYLSAPKA